MKLQTVILEVFKDHNGTLGLGLKGMPRNYDTDAATDGLLIAHDLIEHPNGPEAIGTIDDELEALGGIWYARGQWSDLRRDNVRSRYSVEENISSDVVRMFRDFFYGAHVDLSPIRSKTTPADHAFREIIEISLRDARKELDGDEDPKAVRRREREYFRVCLPRMRRGWHKARRRFERHGRFAANSLFWEIAGAVERYAKHPEEGYEYELTYGFRDGQAFARCEEHFPEDPYDY